jgi:hypothetical protein
MNIYKNDMPESISKVLISRKGPRANGAKLVLRLKSFASLREKHSPVTFEIASGYLLITVSLIILSL